MRRFGILSVVLCALSCSPVPDSRYRDIDLLPPQVQSVQSLGPGEISITFDEDAVLSGEKTRIDPPLAVSDVTGASTRVILRGERRRPSA